jgi:NADH:ubiquinone oxidoreductase subunit 6 (subunit J)
MNDALFWILAATLLGASVLTVTLRRAVNAVVSALVATAALAACCVLLDSPWLGVTVLVVQGAAVLTAGLVAWLGQPRQVLEPVNWGDIGWGAVLSTALIIELTWMFQRLAPAPFAALPDELTPAAGVSAATVLIPVLAIVALALAVAGVKASRRGLW